MKYHPQLISKAKRMYSQGYSYKVIVAELGFESETHVRYLVDPRRKAQQTRHNLAWQKAHPERVRKIRRKADAKYRAKKRLEANAH